MIITAMVLESFQKPIDQLSSLSEEFKKISQMVEQAFGLSDEKKLKDTKQNLEHTVVNETKQEISPLFDQIYEQERQEMLGAIEQYMESSLSPEQRQAFGAMYIGADLSKDIIFFLKEQEYIHYHRTKGNLIPFHTLEKAYAQYDPTGTLQQVMSQIGEYYTQQEKGIAQLTATTQYIQSQKEKIAGDATVPVSKSEVKRSASNTKPEGFATLHPKYQKQTLSQEPIPIEDSNKQIVEKIVSTAKSELGTTEKTGDANKYFQELGYRNHNAKTTPWCGAFVAWVLKKNNLPIPANALSSRAFIGETGNGHVGIKVDGKLISGNYSNKVSLAHVKQPIKGYAIPTPQGLQIVKKSVPFDQIPEGAIVVYTRSKKQQHFV